MSALEPKYLPFPHPTSATKDPGSKDFKKDSIFGQGLYLVELK